MPSKARLIEMAGTQLTKDLIDRGMLIEAGWAAFAHLVISKDAGPVQLREMQLAFMAGAEHVYSSIMTAMDGGDEPTKADLKRMEQIHNELQAWRGKMHERIYPTQGRG